MFDNFDQNNKNPGKSEDEPLPVLVNFTSIDEIDLNLELAEQYSRLKNMLSMVASDKVTPVNQKAQIANSLQNVLQALMKMHTDMYNAERVKTIEAVLISVLKNFPEVQEAFLEQYIQALQAQDMKAPVA